MDPLSDVLSLSKLQSYMSGGFDAGGEWAIAFGKHDGIKFYACVRGACWLSVHGVPDAVYVVAGDCILLPRGRPFRIGTDLRRKPIDLTAATPIANGGVRRINGGGDFFSVGGGFTLTGAHAHVLLEILPPIVHLKEASDKAVLHWCVERMRDELRHPQPGGALIAQQLATTMLIHALRLHLADASKSGVGWLYALADARMATAITAIHEDPAQRWSLQSLAERAGMSRTSFAVRFKETVGESPMGYLTRWRMLLAGDRLATTDDSIAVLASALGYESESAFSTAFKREMGCSPRQYARDGARAHKAVE